MPNVRQSDVKSQLSRLQSGRYPKGYSGEAIARKMEGKVDRFFDDGKKRDGKNGTPAKAIRQAHKTVKQLYCAIGHLKHPDGNIRQDARRLLRSATHPDVSFEQTSRRASKLAGRVRKTGCRRADERREAAAREIDVGCRHRLKEITSKRKLRSAGKSLGNCLAGRHLRTYWSQIQEGDIEVWRVLRRERNGNDWKLRGLGDIRVTKERTIGCCEGPRGAPLKLKRRIAKQILRELNASGDDAGSFVRVGAFTAFLDGRPKVEPLEVGDRLVSMWRYPDQIILMAQDRRGKRTWGRLCRASGAWDENLCVHDEGFSSLLVDLLLKHPSAAENCFPSPASPEAEATVPPPPPHKRQLVSQLGITRADSVH